MKTKHCQILLPPQSHMLRGEWVMGVSYSPVDKVTNEFIVECAVRRWDLVGGGEPWGGETLKGIFMSLFLSLS